MIAVFEDVVSPEDAAAIIEAARGKMKKAMVGLALMPSRLMQAML